MAKIAKVLVANRGEIAARVMRTLRRLGIAIVAIHHDVDADAAFVRDADERVRIAGAPPVAAYLDVAAIVQACQASGADAVHPGFGFLSENAGFAEALEAAGVRFIGPGPAAIRAMGDKIRSKALAREAGVATVPGRPDAAGDADAAVRFAREIGYPVMLKASAGGGGKGMRLAFDEAQCREGFARAASEAEASFGDGRILVERFIERPRHIEIQVLGDAHGNVIHLGERECSIQRRHQKIIEEAPSPFIDEETRQAMGAQAIALARAVGYRSAGTVEFIVDQERSFYFLEMNTRIQVEHPVTEMVTGLDIVEEQIRIAEGEPLRLGQADVSLRGHAIEARLYAEDPDAGFLPTTGILQVLRLPSGPGVRVDSGVLPGQAVTAAFDPMLAKIVAAGRDRAEAIDRLHCALSETAPLGLVTNQAFLRRVLEHPAFRAGDLHTGFLDEHAETLAAAGPTPEEARVLLAAAAFAHPALAATPRAAGPLAAMGGWTN